VGPEVELVGGSRGGVSRCIQKVDFVGVSRDGFCGYDKVKFCSGRVTVHPAWRCPEAGAS